jgi:hypothetical protein
MDRIIVEWSAQDLFLIRSQIQPADFQREPTVWGDRKKALLIDSILIGLDIPKIYLYNPKWYGKDPLTVKVEAGDVFDLIDGQQRIVSVTDFFEGDLRLEDHRYWEDLSEDEKKRFREYKFTIVVITKAEESDLRLLFLRLQLGAPLNVGEKLHALTGDMKDFVFDVGGSHPFFAKVNIPQRRFAKETVFAQICINSFSRALQGKFRSARYEELKAFFEEYSDASDYKMQLERIKFTLDMLDKYFGEKTEEFGNRGAIVSGYLFFEELIMKKETNKLQTFVNFYLEFLNKLSEQSSRGLDYDPRYRELLDFQTNLLQAAVGRSAIEARNRIIEEYFSYYLTFKKIKTAQQ